MRATNVYAAEERNFQDHTGKVHRIVCEQMYSGGWQYVINGVLRGGKFYGSAWDAESEAIEVCIILAGRSGLTKSGFLSLLRALDTSLEEGLAI